MSRLKENNLRHSSKSRDLNMGGQTTLQLVVPLIVILFVSLAFAMLLPMLSTTKTIAIVAGTVIFITCFASNEIALYILIFSMLLSPEFVVGSTEGASMGRGVTLRLDDFLLVIISFSWLAKMAINKELGLFLRTPLNKPIAFYILVCLVSTLLGSLFGRVDLKTGFFYVMKYFEYMIIYFMVVNHIDTKDQVRRYLWAMLITCAIVSIIGIAQIPSGERVSAPFEGEMGEPNTFGGYLFFMMAITTGLFLASTLLSSQLLYGLLTLLFAIPLLYTQSRGSYLAITATMLSFVWLSEKKHWVIMAIVLFGISLPFTVPKPVKERVTYTFTQGRDRADVVELSGIKLDTSTSARLKNWKEASRDWIKHPFLGYGVTGYGFVDTQYVRVITETGFLGFLTFILLISTVFRQAYKIFKQTTEPFYNGLSMGFLAGFIGLLFHSIGANTFIIVRIMEPFWFITAMVIMIPEIEKANDKM
jgi:O-antigen ligase